MASLKPPQFFVVVLAIFLLSHPVHSDGGMRKIIFFKDFNSFRTSANLPAFIKNKNAHCVAEKIAEAIDDDQPCMNPSNSRGNETRLSDYPKAISKCNIDANTTSDVIVLPVCVPKLVPTLVLTNFTRTHYSKFINDKRFRGIGISSEDDWMMVVLASNTPSGSLANGDYSLVNAKVGLGHYMLIFLLGFVVCLWQ